MPELINPTITPEPVIITPLADIKKSVVAPPNNNPYIFAVILMMILGIILIVVIAFIRQEVDLVLLAGVVFGFLSPTTLALLAYMKAQETHLSVNSRLDQFMQNAEMASRLKGRVEGKQLAEDRADEVALQK